MYDFFLFMMIQITCLFGSIILATWGCVRITKIIMNKDWEDHTIFQLLLPLIGIFALSAVLYVIWFADILGKLLTA